MKKKSKTLDTIGFVVAVILIAFLATERCRTDKELEQSYAEAQANGFQEFSARVNNLERKRHRRGSSYYMSMTLSTGRDTTIRITSREYYKVFQENDSLLLRMGLDNSGRYRIEEGSIRVVTWARGGYLETETPPYVSPAEKAMDSITKSFDENKRRLEELTKQNK